MIQKLWQKAQTTSEHQYRLSQNVEQVQRQLNRLRRSRGAGTTDGWHWADPAQYDRDNSYSQNEIVYVQPLNPAVVLGDTDAVTHADVFASAGLWIATQDVAPVEVSPGVFEYHMPYFPLGAADDPDSELNWWWPIAPEVEVAICSTGQTYVFFGYVKP